MHNPDIHFSYNNALQASVGISPFNENYGIHPRALNSALFHVIPAADDIVYKINIIIFLISPRKKESHPMKRQLISNESLINLSV